MKQSSISEVNSNHHTGADTAINQRLNRGDIHWILALYGTAVGAGTLFLPINAGIGGVWPLLLIALLAFPVTFFAHRGLTRFILAGAEQGDRDLTDTLKRFFGPTWGKLLTGLYFFAVFPILLVYSVAITNTVESVLVHQIGIDPLPRSLLSLVLIGILVSIAKGGQRVILRVMSFLVYPFIAALVALALLLIPHWKGDFLATAHQPIHAGHMITTLWLAIPVMVFSFNHTPMISAFSVAQRERYGENAEPRSARLLAVAHLLMVVTVIFFVVSCLMTVSPVNLVDAERQNVSMLSYLADYLHTPVIAIAAPIIALVAISKSFLGHYIGAREGFRGLMGNGSRRMDLLVTLFMFLCCWGVSALNPSILGLIESLGGPVIALLLFLVPMAAITFVPAMARYKGAPSSIFVVIIGLIAVSATFYGFIG